MNWKLFTLFLLLPFLAVGQVWAPIGAKWTYNQNTVNPYYTTYTTFESVSDTVIGAQSCRVIKETERTSPSDSNETLYFMYSDSAYVYNWHVSSWCPLYMFGAVGDSFDVNCTGLIAHILSIDTIWINGHQRRVFQYDAGSMAIDFTGTVIEGIGHTISMFPGYDNSIFAYPLRCYEDTTIGLYKSTYNGESGNQDCEEVINRTAISVVKENEQITISPQPAMNSWIEIDTRVETEVTLFTMIGQKLSEQNIISHERLDLSAYPDGEYLISLKPDNDAAQVKRIIKITR